MEQFLGKIYKLHTTSDSFMDYLKFIGIDLVTRKLMNTFTPVCQLTKNEDGTYSLSQTTNLRRVIVTFESGVEYREDRPDGVKITSKMMLENNKLIEIQTSTNGKISKHIREFTDDTLTVTTTAEGWNGICTRVYKAVDN